MSRFGVRYGSYEGDVLQLNQLLEVAGTNNSPVIFERMRACVSRLETLLDHQRVNVQICNYLHGIVEKAQRLLDGVPPPAIHLYRGEEQTTSEETQEEVAA